MLIDPERKQVDCGKANCYRCAETCEHILTIKCDVCNNYITYYDGCECGEVSMRDLQEIEASNRELEG